MKEIERKWILTLSEINLRDYGEFISVIEQYYLGHGDDPQTRVSQHNLEKGYSTYSLNVKNGRGLSRNEAKIHLSRQEFDKLKEIAVSKVVQRLYLLPIAGGFEMEVSVFDEYNTDQLTPGLIVGEIEFESEETANEVAPIIAALSFVKEDVTGDQRYYGYAIGRKL